MWSDGIEGLEHTEACDGGWDAYGGEAGMSGGGEGAAVIHGGDDGDTGGHFVVEESSDFGAECVCEGCVVGIIGSVGIGIDGAGEIAFEEFSELGHLSGGFGVDDE